jgi:hypothetical protein
MTHRKRMTNRLSGKKSRENGARTNPLLRALTTGLRPVIIILPSYNRRILAMKLRLTYCSA